MSRNKNEADAVTKEVKQGYYFLENLLHPETCTNWAGHHFDFVKIFLCRAKYCDLEAMQPHLTLYMDSFSWSSSLRQNGNEQFFVEIVNFFKRARFSREKVQCLAFKLLNRLESKLPIFQILESPMAIMEFETEVREEMRGAHTDAMVLECNMLLKMVRALKAFSQRRIKALCSPQKLEATLNHLNKALPLPQELEATLNLLKELENDIEDIFKELEGGCLDVLETEAMLVSYFEGLFRS